MGDVIRIDKNLKSLIREYRNVSIDSLFYRLSKSDCKDSSWDKIDQHIILYKYKHGSDLDMIKDCFAKYLLYRHDLQIGGD